MGALDTLSGLRSTGEEFPIEASISQVETSGKKLYTVMIRDIGARKKAEAESRRLHRALQTLSNCNQALVRASSESHLLEEVCGILVREGGYRMAWVGVAEEDVTKAISPVAHAGFEDGYLESAKLTSADKGHGRGPAGRAIQMGETVIVRNIQADPSLLAWRDEALKRGYASGIALPIVLNGRVFGSLTIYAEEPEAFDSAEVELLTELRDDLAYGIQALRIKAEHELAEEVLRESEGQLKEAQRIAHIGSSMWDLATDTTVWSDEIYRITGRDPRRPPPRHSERVSLYTPESWARLESAVQRTLATGEPYALELEVVRPDGTRRQTYARGMPLRDADGRIVLLQGTLQDITERKQAEESLRASEERFRTIFENAGIGIALVDMQGRFIKSNPSLQRWLGYSEEELGRMTFTDYTHPEDRNLVWGLFDELTTGKNHTYAIEKRYLKKDGEVVWGLLTVSIVRDKHGLSEYAVGMVQDITERKRAEEALVRLRQVVDASGEVVFMTNREGIITFVNPEFTSLYGYSAEDVIGKATPAILERSEGGVAEGKGFWQDVLSDKRVQGEVVNYTKDGRRVIVDRYAMAILDHRGDAVGFVSIKRDITARKQLEQQFLQAQKMEAVGRLAGGVAHDFNNLLGIITGYTDLILEDPSVTGRSRQRVEEIKRAATRAVEVTRQLLAFSRKQVLETRPLDLNAAVRDTTKMLGHLIGEDIELVTVFAPDLGSVEVDPTGIDQVLVNLTVNARDAMPHGGKLKIETANVVLDDTYAAQHISVPAGSYVALKVSDTGTGMDPETCKHIFEPFFTTKEPGRGTGLGLSTVYGIVQQSGGYISVYSELGCGTIFTIYLPRVEVAVPAAQAGSVQAVARGSETVLLVEDDEGLRKLGLELLHDLGYNVLPAGNAVEAIAASAAHTGPLHILMTDIVMPGMNGQKLAEVLIKRRPGLRVLFVSGYTDSVVSKQISHAGAAFLQKPLARRTLAEKLRELLDTPTITGT